MTPTPCDEPTTLTEPVGLWARELLRSCEEMDDFCLGYAAGVADAASRERGNVKCAVQLPAGVELSQLRDIILNALRHKVSGSDQLASIVFKDALATAFPCNPS